MIHPQDTSIDKGRCNDAQADFLMKLNSIQSITTTIQFILQKIDSSKNRFLYNRCGERHHAAYLLLQIKLYFD